MLSMTVTKANIRRLAEVVFTGAKGKKTSHVSFPNLPAEKKHPHAALNLAVVSITAEPCLCLNFWQKEKADHKQTYCQTGELSVGCSDPGNAE